MTQWVARTVVPVLGAALWAVGCRADGGRGQADNAPAGTTPSGIATTPSSQPPAPCASSSLGQRRRAVARRTAVRVPGVPATVGTLASDGQRLVWADERGLGEVTAAGVVRRFDGATAAIRDVGAPGSAVAWLEGGEGTTEVELWWRREAAPEKLLAGSGWGGSVRLAITPAGWFVGGISGPGWLRIDPGSRRRTRIESECNEADVGFLDASASVVAAVGSGRLCVGTPTRLSLRHVPGREPVSALAVDGDEVFFAAGGLGSDTDTESSLYGLRAGAEAPVELASGETFVVSVLRSSGRLYWLDERGALRGLGRQGEVTTLGAGPRGPRGSPGWRLAVVGRTVYWIVPGMGLFRAELDGTG